MKKNKETPVDLENIILKDNDFELITAGLTLNNDRDSLTIGLCYPKAEYDVYINRYGQFILNPVQPFDAQQIPEVYFQKDIKEFTVKEVRGLGSCRF